MAGEAATLTTFTPPRVYTFEFEEIPEHTTPEPVPTPGWWKEEAGFKKAKKRKDTEPERDRDLYEPFFKYWRERDQEEGEEVPVLADIPLRLERYELNEYTRTRGPYQPKVTTLAEHEIFRLLNHKSCLEHKGADAPTQPYLKCLELDLARKAFVYEQGFKLAIPDKGFYEVMNLLGFESEDLKATIEEYEEHYCNQCVKTFLYPRPIGGRWNPYVAYDRSKRSALRAWRMLEGFEKVASITIPDEYKEATPRKGRKREDIETYNITELTREFLIDIVTTYPKEITRGAIRDTEQLKRVKKRAIKLFTEYLSEYLGTEEQELGGVVNTHTWRSDPFTEKGEFEWWDILHLHHHFKIPSWMWNPSNKKYERMRPGLFRPIKTHNKEKEEITIINFNERALRDIKNIWNKVVETIIHEEGYNLKEQTNLEGDKIRDVYVQFIPIEDKRRIIHTLKYQGRSFVVDLANWTAKSPDMEINKEFLADVKAIMETGLINKSEPFGFWKKFNTIKDEYLENSEEIKKEAEELSKMYHTYDEKDREIKAEEIRQEIIEREKTKYETIITDKRRICPICENELDLERVVKKKRLKKEDILSIELGKKGEIVDIWR